MANNTLSNTPYETYLALEADAQVKYEYHDGFVVAMAGGTPRHSQLGANAVTALNMALRVKKQPCRTYNSDLKVRIEATNRTYFPDATVVCQDPQFSLRDPHALTNPILIVEILSDRTEAFDRGDKFFHYRQLHSLREYVLVSQTKPLVETFYRNDEGRWEFGTAYGLEATLSLKSLGIEIGLQEVFFQVEGINEQP